MQDVIPPRNGQDRGMLRPTARSVAPGAREPERVAARPVRSMDGVVSMKPVAPPAPVSAPTPTSMPAQVPPPVTNTSTPQPVAPKSYPEPPRFMDRMKPGSVKSQGPVEPTYAKKGISQENFTEALNEPVGTIESAEFEPSSDSRPTADGVATTSDAAAPTKEQGKKTAGWKRFVIIAVAVVLVSVVGYVAVNAWLTDPETSVAQQTPVDDSESDAWATEEEGQDESIVTENILANYTVAPELPRALYSEKLSIAARILPMSVNTAGSIQAPLNIYDAGWYTGSAKPGEIGAMFIDGHASGPTREGLFAYLDTLKVGDELQAEKGDGSKLTYKVVHVETVPLAEVDMKKVLQPYGNAAKAMNLMTCTGKWLPREKTYDHRVLVYTEQV